MAGCMAAWLPTQQIQMTNQALITSLLKWKVRTCWVMLGVTRTRLFRIKIPLGFKAENWATIFRIITMNDCFLANELLLQLIGGLDANAVDFDTPPRCRWLFIAKSDEKIVVAGLAIKIIHLITQALSPSPLLSKVSAFFRRRVFKTK